MNTLGKLKLGDKIFVCGANNHRYCIIKKIGSVYFTVNINGIDTKFKLSDWMQKTTGYGYGYDYKLYKDKSEYLAMVKLAKAHSRVASAIHNADGPVLTIDQYLIVEKWIGGK